MIQRAGRWTLECAPEDTRRFYDARSSGAAERCACLYCRNFAEAREVVYAESLQEQLGQLGVDWRKEDEAPEFGLLSSGLRVYIPWFTFVGRVVEIGPEEDDAELTITEASAPILGEMGDRGRLLQLNLKLEVPWVIADEEPNF